MDKIETRHESVVNSLYKSICYKLSNDNKIRMFTKDQLDKYLLSNETYNTILNNLQHTQNKEDYPVLDYVDNGRNEIYLDHLTIDTKSGILKLTGSKVCSVCKKELPLTDFGKTGVNSRSATGRHSACKKCIRLKMKEPKQLLSFIHRYLDKNPKIDLKFTREEMWDSWLRPDSEFMKLYNAWDKININDTPRIELIDKTKPYTLDNIRPITMRILKRLAKESTTKVCQKCKKELPKEAFSINSKTKDGRDTTCKQCTINESRDFHKLGWRMYNGMVGRSKRRGHALPAYDKYEFQKWLENQPNYKTLYNNWKEHNWNENYSPSIDRINNYIGYTLDNIQLTTREANNGKERIPVLLYDKRGNLLKYFVNIKNCAEYLEIHPVTIFRNVKKGKFYYNEHIVIPERIFSEMLLKSILKRVVTIVDNKDKILSIGKKGNIKVYDNIKDCSSDTNDSPKAINNILRSGNKRKFSKNGYTYEKLVK